MHFNKDIWYSPRKIVFSFLVIKAQVGEKIEKAQEYKLHREEFSVALALFAIQKMQNMQFWLQLVNPRESTPDIRTATVYEKNKKRYLSVHDIEVVTYEEHSSDSVHDFLKRTKLVNTKLYPDVTTILCHVAKYADIGKLDEIATSLKSVKRNNDTWVLGRIHKTKDIYQLVRVHPEPEPIVHFDLEEELFKDALDMLKTEMSMGNLIIPAKNLPPPF